MARSNPLNETVGILFRIVPSVPKGILNGISQELRRGEPMMIGPDEVERELVRLETVHKVSRTVCARQLYGVDRKTIHQWLTSVRSIPLEVQILTRIMPYASKALIRELLKREVSTCA